MKKHQIVIYISSAITFLVAALIPLAAMLEKLSANYIISSFAFLGIASFYLIMTLHLIKTRPENQKGIFLALNPVINFIAMLILFFCFFFTDQIQDFLFYSLGIGVHYVQSPLFTIVFPALLSFGIGIIGHIIAAKTSQKVLL